MHDLSGQVIRGYELRELAGAGGFGAVYRAHQPSVDREVAVKVILPQYASRPDFILRFESEARLIARLEHPHIVPLYDYWRERDGTAYLVMRWLRGGSLRKLLRNGPLSFDFTARLLDQVVQALSVAHQAGVVHRDLKPDNILFDEHHNAYLSDFGIAKDLMAQVNMTPVFDLAPATPAYAAPEQFSDQPITPQTDLYSLGITLYECLTGNLPFPLRPLQHLYDPLPFLPIRRPDAPPGLDRLLRRATARNPADRYPDAPSLAEAFHQALAAPPEGVTTPPTHIPHRFGPGVLTPAVTMPSQPPEAAARDQKTPPLAQETAIPGAQSALLLNTAADVPLRPRRLIGRDTLLDEIEVLLDQKECVLLQGFGGIGKTTLATELTVRWLTAGRGPVLWLKAGSEQAPALFEALARPFNAHGLIAGASDEQRMAMLRRLLSEQGVTLVVLDNVWNGAALKQVLDALPFQMPVLVTSRQRFPLDRIVDVPGLELDKALQLLSEHAGQQLAGPAAVELCHRLVCHPLALKIAGETLKVEQLPPFELLQRIADAPHRITMPEGFAEEGHHSIKELLDDSVNTLNPDTRDVFLAFGGLFASEATPELIALCMNWDPRAAGDALGALQRRGLAERMRLTDSPVSYYRIHDLAYSYTRANTWLSQEEAIAACREYATQNAKHLPALDAERTNVLRSADAAHHSGDDASLIAIMRALTADRGYLDARGYDSLVLQELDKAIEAAARLAPAYDEALHYMLEDRGDAYALGGDLDHALKAYQAALQFSPNPHREATILSVIGGVRFRQGADDYDTYLEQAFQIARTSNDDLVLCRVLEARGNCARETGDYETAREFLTQAVQVAEPVRHPRLFDCLYNLGLTMVDLGRFPEALSIHKRAYQVARDIDSHFALACAYSGMACAYHGLGEHDKAQAHFDKALEFYRKVGALIHVDWVVHFLVKAGYSPELKTGADSIGA